ncbi:MAG: hypothetical protein EPN82_08685 [Bacteroidetes bacterium]|nr:MAG: hypothetical protein EPN82_08685 [Bacteroidota bacterium]
MKELTISKKLILILLSFILFSACSENISYNDVIKLSVNDIVNTPTNSWFKTEMILYNPDTNITKQIISNFDVNKNKVYLFADFSCGCNNQQTDIAHLCKVFANCSIPETNYEIYSVKSKTSKHPYTSLFTLYKIPECVVMKDTNAVYFMLDTMRYYEVFGQTIPIEQLLLNGLKK